MSMFGMDLTPQKDEEALLRAGAMPEIDPIRSGYAQAPPVPEQGGAGMGMGMGNMMQGVSKSLFGDMSQEQIYKMGLAFNTLRFEPDAQLAANLESRLLTMDKNKSSQAAMTNAVNALLNFKSDQYPNGRVDLADLVRQGVMTGKDAVKEAMKKPTVSKTQELLGIFNDEDNPYNLTDEQRKFGTENALGISVTKNDFETARDMYLEMEKAGTLTPHMMSLLGIPKETQTKFQEDMQNLTLFAEQNGMKPAELAEKQLALITGVQPDDGKTDEIRKMDYRAKEAGLERGTDEYKAFFLKYGQSSGVTVNNNLGENEEVSQKSYGDALQKELATSDQKEVMDMRAAVKAIEKLDRILGVIQDGDPNLGALQGLKQRADELLAKFTGSKEAYASATDTQILEALLGSDVFGMINILGIGARGIDTPAERDFLIRVMTGEQKMTKAALEQMTYYRRKYSRMVLDDFNTKLDGGYFDNYQKYGKKLKRAVYEPLAVYTPPLLEDTISIDRANELLLKYPTQRTNQ